MSKKPTLYLLDANSLLHRAWHAIPPLTTSDGVVVNAVFGVLNVTLKLIQEKKPDAFAAAWDTEAPTFRHEAYAAYKGTREEKPNELYAQIPIVQEGLEYLGIASLWLDGFEADDILGTMAKKYIKKGWEVVIVTGDRDLLQLIEPGLSVLAFKRGVTETVLYDAKEVMQQYGLTIDQFVEYKAMRGDPSDNIPGIKGIGDKTATQLLQKYKHLKGIFKAAHDTHSDIKPGVRSKLLAAEDGMEEILDLVRINTKVPLSYTPTRGSVGVTDQEVMRAFLQRMDFKSLIKRLDLQSSAQPSASHKSRGAQQVVTVAGAREVLEQLKQSKRLAVLAGEVEEATLFTQTIDALGITDGKRSYCFSGAALSSEAVRKLLQAVFDDASIEKITHDAKSVMKALATASLQIRDWHFDTMLAGYLIGAGERNHDLYLVAEKFAGIRLAADAPLLQKLEAVFASTTALETALKEEGLEKILEDFELPLVPVLFDMESVGIKIDIPFLKSLSVRLTKERDRLEARMVKMIGKAFNPASPSQLSEILFEDLQLPTKGIKKGKTGYSTAASELEKLRGQHEIIEYIEQYRETSKLLSTYIDVLPGLADKKSRIHTTYQQAVTATGRLSSINPNLQNIPIRTASGREIRKAFVAKRGYVLLACDYSQIELRIAAALSQDEAMMQAFIDHKDIHTETAASIWGIEADEVTKEQRRVAKAINFGILFGQGPMGLSRTASISFAEAKEFIRAYFETYPGLATYLEETKKFVRKHGYAETHFGRKRPIPEIQSHVHQVRAQAERMAINMPIQGTEADIIKLAMIQVAKELSTVSKKTRMLLQVHDELLFEVPSDEVAQVGQFAERTMAEVCDLGVPITVETKQGKNWQDMKVVL